MKTFIPGRHYDVLVKHADREHDVPDVELVDVEYIGRLDAEQVFRDADATLEAMFDDEIIQAWVLPNPLEVAA